MKSSFHKHDLRTWHWQCKLNFWIGAYRVVRKELFLYILACTYVLKLFSKALSMNLALALQAQVSGWRLSRFGKELFVYVSVYKYTEIHMCVLR